MIGTLEHQLLKCPALLETRANAVSPWAAYLVDKPNLFPIVSHHTLSSEQLHMELLLDPSTCPKVISAAQEYGQGILSLLLYMTRTWSHAHHVKRKRLLRLHNIL